MNAAVFILAGGVGSRLGLLAQGRAKPAVPFAGIYRIIDFTLSNVMNSGLYRVGVLTQYQPLSLMDHLATGAAWDMAGRSRGIRILPPATGRRDSDWYRGTADAVRQNLDYLAGREAPETLVLSGDHVYCMDYRPLIAFHRERGAKITVAVIEVGREEIRRYGAAEVDGRGLIRGWEEKPARPRTTLASMGVYVFDSGWLVSFLEKDRAALDFGRDVIPAALAAGERVAAFPFAGYWRDVGTVEAYWRANMDVISVPAPVSPERWGVRPNPETYGGFAGRPPARFLASARVEGSLVSAGCRIAGTVVDSVLSPGVVVEEGAVVRGSILFSDTVVRRRARCEMAVVDREAEIAAGAAHHRAGPRSRRSPCRGRPESASARACSWARRSGWGRAAPSRRRRGIRPPPRAAGRG